ncbi:MoaD/ThiS family protein [Thermosphaera sp.]
MSFKNYIRVKVRYHAPLIQSVVGVESEELILEEGAKLKDLLKKIARARGRRLEQWFFSEDGELNQGILLIVNGSVVHDLDKDLNDMDEVLLTIPFDGG